MVPWQIYDGTLTGEYLTLSVRFVVSSLIVLLDERASIRTMAEKPTKRSRKQTSTPDKAKNLCVTCKVKVRYRFKAT